jgi:crossover junction endodeoxyribonuclease RusA
MLFIAGIPRPQGSKKAFNRGGRIVLVEAAAGLKEWRELVGILYRQQKLEFHSRPAAVTVDLTFLLPQIKKPKLRYPTTKPDIDKLSRAILDALTGIAYEDDSQVVQLKTQKVYTFNEPGVYITVSGINNDYVTTRINTT